MRDGFCHTKRGQFTYLGHSSTSITMDMYVHEQPEKEKVRRPFDRGGQPG
ncbi:MAG TPA: hypothetical protein VFB30_12425 [Spirochaetia bacterium]|nr:hypothetical protein [Spirochaetia bacterium]